MDIRQLRYFISIVEQGSFSKAADALNVAQPALSLHVRNMEAELGSSLLLRTPQGVVATEAGQILMRHARIMIDQLSIARHEIKGREMEPKGEVRLALPAAIGQILSVPLVLEARKHFPKIRLRLAEAIAGLGTEWIRQEQIDLAIVYMPGFGKPVNSLPLAVEELWLVGPTLGISGVQPPSSGAIHYSAAAKLPLILPCADTGLRFLLEREAHARGLSLSVMLEVDSCVTIKQLVEQGVGYSILPLNSIAPEVQCGRLSAWPVVEPRIKRSLHLFHPVDRPLTEAVAAVDELCRSTSRDLVATGKWCEANVVINPSGSSIVELRQHRAQ